MADKEKKKHGDHPDCATDVAVTINGRGSKIRPGRMPVSEIKKFAGIPAADVLAEITNGKVRELTDNCFADVQDCDVFVSFPRECASS